MNVAPEVQHAQPARDEEDGRLGDDLETGGFQHLAQLTPRKGPLVTVRIQPKGAQRGHEQRAKKGIVQIGHADDRAALPLQDAKELMQSCLRIAEVLDRPHGIDRVE